jgi:hypothetical protein
MHTAQRALELECLKHMEEVCQQDSSLEEPQEPERTA